MNCVHIRNKIKIEHFYESESIKLIKCWLDENDNVYDFDGNHMLWGTNFMMMMCALMSPLIVCRAKKYTNELEDINVIVGNLMSTDIMIRNWWG